MREHPKPQSGTRSAALQRTDTPGIYRRGDRYVTTWRQAGRQRKASFATLAEAREAKAAHERGERPVALRVGFDRYALEWIETYRGRTRRGLAHSTRADYRRTLELCDPIFRRHAGGRDHPARGPRLRRAPRDPRPGGLECAQELRTRARVARHRRRGRCDRRQPGERRPHRHRPRRVG